MSLSSFIAKPVSGNASLANMDVTKDLSSLDASTNAKGQKTAAIVRNGQPAYWTFTSPAVPLFQPSAYNGTAQQGQDTSNKLSLCLSVQPDVMAQAEALDTWAIQYAVDNSSRLFGKVLTPEQIKDRYSPVVRKCEKYPPYIKLKISTANERNAPSYWTMDKEQREPPENWQRCSMQCHCRLVGFWVMTTSFGCSVQLNDALVDETEIRCPF